MSREEQFGIVKGWLIAKEAPPAILDALASIRPEALRIEVGPSAVDGGWTPHSFEEGDVGQVETPSGAMCFDLPPSQSVTAAAGSRRRGRQPRMGDECLHQVRQDVADGLSDVEIGKRFGVGSQTVADFRRRHGIAKRQGKQYQKTHSWGYSGAKAEATPLRGETVTYTDEDGRTVTKLPPGYAQGITPGVTANSSKGY